MKKLYCACIVLLFQMHSKAQCIGISGNQLINPSFEVPAQNIVGNNFLTWPINGWNGAGSAPNIVKTNGGPSTGGPNNAQSGVQYLDIVNGAADFYQEFNFQCHVRVFFSGYFSIRDNTPSNGRIDLLRVNNGTTTLVASSNQLNMPSTANIWYLASGSAVIPPGTYRFNITMGDYSNFDDACFSFDSPIINTGSYGPICENIGSILLTGTPADSLGSWSGSGIVDNGNGTASFNPSGLGGSVVSVSYAHYNSLGFGCTDSTNIIVNSNITPTFTPVSPICSGATLSALPTTSNNGITGTWSPALNNTVTTTYTFTPANGQCATTTNLTVTVNPNITPTFTPVSPICSGATLSALPTTSNNGITGTWSPALNNTVTTTYTFTPANGQCATTTNLTVTVNPNITPTFTPVSPICSGATLSALPTTSNNGITGTWSPALNNTVTTTYTFTPANGQCATTTNLTVTVNPNITPTFTPVSPICSGATLSALPTTSNNGITGTWSPALNNTVTTTYTFTPANGQCATTTNLTVTVNPNITPTFTPVSPICSGESLSSLPTTSNNGITGTWSPALNNTITTTYTFTPTTGQCATTTNLTVTVNPNITPTFTPVSPICSGATLSALPTTSNNGITGTWSPALNNTVTTTYTFTPSNGQCATITNLTVKVNPNITPMFTPVSAICSGESLSSLPTTSNNGITGTWSPALNNTITTTYTFTPTTGQCATITNLTIVVKDGYASLFLPNTFTPNGDGLNDIFIPFSTEIVMYNIKIFNRWGEMIFETDDFGTGWDGIYKGSLAQVGVYVWIINYRTICNRDLQKTGRITLL